MVRPQRRFLASLTLLSIAVAVVQACLGLPELALFFGPVLIVVALLLSGRFLGERRILARRPAPAVRARRAPQVLRRPAGTALPRTMLALRQRIERGPPAASAA